MGEAENWSGAMGQKWARYAEALERQLEPAGLVGLERLNARPGEVILDLGCGSGATTAAIGEAVGARGSVTGIDISEDQLGVGRIRPGNERAAFLLGNAQTYPFEADHFDAVFSRFGCMFFDDPHAAYANIIGALKPGGRICFVVWNALGRNLWASIPAMVATELLGPPEPVPPGTPGPFAWSDPGIFRPILEGAGFRNLTWTEAAVTLPVGEDTGEEPALRAARMLTLVGPLARRLAAKPDTLVAKAVGRLEAELAPYVDGDFAMMLGAIWVIEAVR
jgi:SAM-dependent methyltransferase